jgi:uncharacterized protein
MTTRFIDLGDGAVLDTEVMLEEGQRLLIQGSSGAGKSRTQRLILESLPPQVQQVIFDVEDEAHTLRSEDRPYVILGGEYADAPGLENMDAAELAMAILKMGTSVIFQINDWGVEAQSEFMNAYLSSLMKAPRDLWRPVMVVIDEAHRYAPNQGLAPSSAAIELLATAGRKRLFSAMLATPRISDFSASVRGVCNNKMLGRVDSATDRRTSADALGVTAKSPEALELDHLKNGQFWLSGPLFGRKQLVQLRPSQTLPPKAGVACPPAAAPAKLVKALAALVRETADESQPRRSAVSAGEVRIEYRTDPAEIAKAKDEGITIGKEIGSAETWDNLFAFLREKREADEGRPEPIAPQRAEVTAHRAPKGEPKRAVKAERPVRSAKQDVFSALKWFTMAGQPAPTREMIAAAVGASVGERSFSSEIGSLVARGDVKLGLNSTLSLASRMSPAPGASRIATIRDGLRGHHQAIYDMMLGGSTATASQIMKSLGLAVSGGSVDRNVTALVRMGVLEKVDGGVQLTAWARGELTPA